MKKFPTFLFRVPLMQRSRIVYKASVWFFIMGLLMGCVGSDVKPLAPASVNYPDWILNPHQPNDRQLYGVGEGQTRDAAIQSALVDLLSQLSIEVAASFETRLSVHQQDFESVERVSEKQIQASVANTEIRNYQVKQIQRLSYDKTVALIAVSRKQLLADIQASFEQALARLKSQQHAQTGDYQLVNYLFYRRHLPQVDALQQQLKVLNALDRGFDDVGARRYLQQFSETALQLKHTLVFELIADAPSQKWVAVIENALSQAGFKAQKTARPGQNAQILLTAQVSESEAYGFKIVRVNLNNRVMSGGQQLGGEYWMFKGQALSKEVNATDLALQRVAQKIQDLIETQGLNAFLGLDLVR